MKQKGVIWEHIKKLIYSGAFFAVNLGLAVHQQHEDQQLLLAMHVFCLFVSGLHLYTTLGILREHTQDPQKSTEKVQA